MDREAWCAVHGVTKSRKKDLTDAFDKYGSSIVIGKTKIKKPKLVLGYIK